MTHYCAICGGDWFAHPNINGKVLWCDGDNEEPQLVLEDSMPAARPNSKARNKKKSK